MGEKSHLKSCERERTNEGEGEREVDREWEFIEDCWRGWLTGREVVRQLGIIGTQPGFLARKTEGIAG